MPPRTAEMLTTIRLFRSSFVRTTKGTRPHELQKRSLSVDFSFRFE
jgi:hypothetical protein